MSRLTAIAVAAAMLAVCPIARAQEHNRAPNPGFEQTEADRPAGWSPGAIAGDRERVILAYLESPRGGRCVSIESRDPEAKAGWSVAERIPVMPGQRIRVRLMVRLEDVEPGPGGGDGFIITCHFYDRTSYLTWARSAGEIGSADWHAVEFECAPPEGAQAVVLGFRLSRCTGRALVDDVELYAEGSAEVPAPERYGLQPGDPGVTSSVVMLTGAAAHSDATRQVVDLLNREGIAVVAEDPASAARFPASAGALRVFDCVMIGAINPETGAGLLSADQVRALRQYVSAGGGLVACVPAVAGTPLAECFPARIGAPVRGWHFIPETTAGAHPILADLTFPWPGFGSKPQEATCYELQPGDGAEVLAEVPSQVAGRCPFLLTGELGEGRTVLMNSSWVGAMAWEFLSWRYAPRLLGQMVRWAAGAEPLAADAKPPLPDPHEPIAWGGRWHGAAPEEPRTPPDPATLPEATVHLGDFRPGPAVEVPVRGVPEIAERADAVTVRFANGVRLVMHHAAQVELFAPAGTALTAPPADEMPLIATSGSEAPELTVDLEAGASEPQIFRAPIENERLLASGYEYAGCAVEGSGVVFSFRALAGDGPPATLRWSFMPRSVEIEGRLWQGVGDRYEVEAGERFIDSILGRYPWRIGATVTDDRTMRLACYSVPRGWFEMPLSDLSADSNPNNTWSFFCSGQPFQVLGGAEGTLLLYYDEATQVRARQMLMAGRDAIYLDNRVVIGRRRGTVATPRQWMLFTPQPLTPNLWMTVYDHIKREYADRYGFTPSRPVPCGQMRLDALGVRGLWRGRTVRMAAEVDLDTVAEYFLPLAAERAMRRVDVGTMVNPEHPLDFEAEPERVAALRRFFARAHELGLQALSYWRISYWNEHAALVVEHPHWWNRNRDGTPLTGFQNLVNLSLRSGWYEWSRDALLDLHERIGLDGVWFDTLTAGMDAINYAEPEPQPTVARGMEYFRELRQGGLEFWVEGMHPLALDSYWYRHDKYAPFAGVEFALFDSSMFAQGPDSLIFLDPFRLAAFRAPMMAEVSELTVAEDPITREQARCNRLLNAAEDALGEVQAVRATEFGSIWVGTRGYALFAFQDRRVSLTGLGDEGWQVDLPESRGGALTVAGGRGAGHMLAGEVALITRR